MRWGPSTSNGIITKIPQGTTVRVISTSNGWDKVYYSGEVGFCSNSYLTTTSPTNPALGDSNPSSSITAMNKEGQVTGVASNDTLNMRSETSSTSSIVAKLPNGTKVQVIGQDTKTSWYKINYDGKTGYVSNKYIKINGDWNSSASSITGTRKTTDNLNFRTGPGTNYSIIANIPKGTVIDYYSESNGWAKVRYNGKDGYVSTSYLTTNTSSTTTIKKITTANVNMRTGASTSHSIIKTVASNTVVEVISSSGSWDKI